MNSLLITLIFTSFALNQDAMAQSRLLDGVKRNPDEAKSICKSFSPIIVSPLCSKREIIGPTRFLCKVSGFNNTNVLSMIILLYLGFVIVGGFI